MEPIFTLPYPEYKIIEVLTSKFKKNKGYSVLIPTSRQNKGFDLIVYNNKNKKSTTIQVKSSRIYMKDFIRTPKEKSFRYYTWFNKFNLEKGLADFYLLFGLYPKDLLSTKLNKSKVPNTWYSSIILVFEEEEMLKLNSNLVTRKGKKDTMFGFGFNTANEITLTRGELIQKNYSAHLFRNKINKIKELLD